ncbi:MAG TPA: peptide-methionine (S)-S-oxide reductase MsrA [Cytophagaceae bacterium]|jgi:peptide-methionine (S)-S-oxide reductase|nr:peptide-methionine (S)-S-oxide reductase MsrA [Cytophagaceae bacterium]
MKLMYSLLGIFAAGLLSCSTGQTKQVDSENIIIEKTYQGMTDTATFGAGCFWCVEAVFQDLEGVVSVASGYEGGKISKPTYKEVCSGLTGHAEVIQLVFDPSKISYKELLEVFWQTHDPTTLNRQGHDSGTQYRSVIFYHNEEQKNLAEKYKNELNAAKAFDKPIVTEISPAQVFYKAENYHQDYYNLNGSEPYCTFVIKPKVDKVKKVFGDKLKKE